MFSVCSSLQKRAYYTIIFGIYKRLVAIVFSSGAPNLGRRQYRAPRVRIHGLRRKINAEGEEPLIRAVKDTGYALE